MLCGSQWIFSESNVFFLLTFLVKWRLIVSCNGQVCKSNPCGVLHETDESSDNSSSEINEATPTTTSGKCSAKKRKYDEDYLQYGFIESVINPGRQQCVMCNKVLSNEALKPIKQKRHWTKQLPEVQHKRKDYFLRKKGTGAKQQTVLKMTLIPNEKSLKASYLVAQRVARAK